jgi:hypothetical protein
VTTILDVITEALVDSLSDIGDAIDEIPGDVDQSEIVAAFAAHTRTVDRLLELLGGAE